MIRAWHDDSLLKSNQEQAVASWINYLNQLRLDNLMKTLRAQDVNLANAVNTLNETYSTISAEIIIRNRGGAKGMHGFIAEVAECGIGNARQQILGRAPNYKWINDNGPSDLMRDSIYIQQKFVNSGGHLSLNAIKMHHESYPNYLSNGGRYLIPKDHYERIKYYLSISESKANRLATGTGEFSLKQWQEVHTFFRQGDISFNDIEPSALEYRDVQTGTINGTFQREKQNIKEADRALREDAYQKSRPGSAEAFRVATASAAVEGGFTFATAVIQKMKQGKRINEFTPQDWNEICAKSGAGVVKGGIRGVSIYALTNFTATPAAVASSIVSASFGIAEQAHQLRQGMISREEFLHNSQILCVDVSVSALSSLVGQAFIPIPVLGAVIGNTIGTYMYRIAKDNLNQSEVGIIRGYLTELRQLDMALDRKYQELLINLNTMLDKYYNLLMDAFSINYAEALNGSAQLAIFIGVPSSTVMKSLNDVDHYFLD